MSFYWHGTSNQEKWNVFLSRSHLKRIYMFCVNQNRQWLGLKLTVLNEKGIQGIAPLSNLQVWSYGRVYNSFPVRKILQKERYTSFYQYMGNLCTHAKLTCANGAVEVKVGFNPVQVDRLHMIMNWNFHVTGKSVTIRTTFRRNW